MTTCIDCGKIKKSKTGKRCRECMFKSQEYLEKLRKKSLENGSKPPIAWGNKTNVGRKHTQEWKDERRRWNKEHNWKPPTNYGKDNFRWNNDATPLRMKIWLSYKHRQWRSDIFTRDDFTCQECGERGGILHVHHIKPFSLIMRENQIKTYEQAIECEELWNINNGITLCKECHKKTDSYLRGY